MIASILLSLLDGSLLAGAPLKSYSTHQNMLQIWARQPREQRALAAAFFSASSYYLSGQLQAFCVMVEWMVKRSLISLISLISGREDDAI